MFQFSRPWQAYVSKRRRQIVDKVSTRTGDGERAKIWVQEESRVSSQGDHLPLLVNQMDGTAPQLWESPLGGRDQNGRLFEYALVPVLQANPIDAVLGLLLIAVWSF
jgi:hypothetical protein